MYKDFPQHFMGGDHRTRRHSGNELGLARRRRQSPWNWWPAKEGILLFPLLRAGETTEIRLDRDIHAVHCAPLSFVLGIVQHSLKSGRSRRRFLHWHWRGREEVDRVLWSANYSLRSCVKLAPLPEGARRWDSRNLLEKNLYCWVEKREGGLMEWTWSWRITEQGRFSWKIRRKRTHSLLCKNTIFVIHI